MNERTMIDCVIDAMNEKRVFSYVLSIANYNKPIETAHGDTE